MVDWDCNITGAACQQFFQISGKFFRIRRTGSGKAGKMPAIKPYIKKDRWFHRGTGVSAADLSVFSFHEQSRISGFVRLFFHLDDQKAVLPFGVITEYFLYQIRV